MINLKNIKKYIKKMQMLQWIENMLRTFYIKYLLIFLKKKIWIEQIEVPPIGFDKIVLKHDIDILQIDTEGYDYEILKLVFATGIYPIVINMEYNSSQKELLETLHNYNYSFVEHNGDLLATKKDIIKLSPWAFKFNILAKKIIRRLVAK
ncbi:MAG: FkbM family methyltransferase [Campylobacterota bacterium]